MSVIDYVSPHAGGQNTTENIHHILTHSIYKMQEELFAVYSMFLYRKQ